MTHRLRGEGWPCPWHLWSETAAGGREPAGWSRFFWRGLSAGNAPQERVVQGSLVALVPSRKERDADTTASQGCVSHIADPMVAPGGILLRVLTFLENP